MGKESGMIAHFFDIKKEKQDRILNAVLKVFAQNGYRRASTDDMVREASISKGLLFHYFSTKANMYEFVYRYSVKYMTMELFGVLGGKGTDYFLLKQQIEEVKYKVLRNFPYMPLFLAEAELEQEQQNEEIRSIRESWHETLQSIEERADFSFLDENTVIGKEELCKLTDYTLEGILREAYASGSPDADAVCAKAAAYLEMIRQLCSPQPASGILENRAEEESSD